MRHFNQIFVGLFAAMITAAGCNGAESTPIVAAENPKDARLSLTAQGAYDANVKVTAIDEATKTNALVQSLTLKAGSTTLLQLALPAAAYTFQVEAFADAGEKTMIGEGTASAKIQADQVTEVELMIDTDGEDGTASIHLSTDVAPMIHHVKVTLGSSALVAAEVQLDATDADGDALRYFWSGFGIQGVVEGSAQLTISAAAAAADKGERLVHVVVQDAQGASTTATIDLAASSDMSGSDDTGGEAGVDMQACLEAHAGCSAACNAAAAASLEGAADQLACVGSCGVTLVTCESKKN